MEQVDGFFLAVSLLSTKRFGALNKLHVDGNFDLQHVHSVAVLGELAHALGDDQGLFLCVFKALFVGAILIANELEKERNIVSPALVADSLNPGMLLVVDLLGIKGSVVEQNLYAIGACFFNALRRPVAEEIGQATRAGLVVSGFLVGKQQAGVLGAALGCRQ